jgi:phage baseplate assembly protein V
LAVGINTVRRLVGNVKRKVQLVVARGVINRVNDALKCQGVQITLLADEVHDDVEHFQEYGFTSHAFTDAEGVHLSVGGNRAHGIVVCVHDRRYRPLNLGEGDVCLFTDKGERVYIESTADLVHLGAKSGAEFVALATKVLTELQKLETDINDLKTVFSGWVTVPNDGGAALKTAAAAWYGSPVSISSVAASKVKAT